MLGENPPSFRGAARTARDAPLQVSLGVFGRPVCFDKYDRAGPLSDSALTVLRASEGARWQTPEARKKRFVSKEAFN